MRIHLIFENCGNATPPKKEKKDKPFQQTVLEQLNTQTKKNELQSQSTTLHEKVIEIRSRT